MGLFAVTRDPRASPLTRKLSPAVTQSVGWPTSSLAQRLRLLGDAFPLLHEAADYIEALEDENKVLATENTRLKATPQ